LKTILPFFPFTTAWESKKIKNISLSRKDFKKLKSFTIKTVKYFNVKKAVASVSGRFFYHPRKRVGGERAPFRLHGKHPTLVVLLFHHINGNRSNSVTAPFLSPI
jgi:hypothetical protein